MVRLLFSVLIPLLLIALPTQALDTSTGVGLQDRALFQETVDYTLTNQSGGDFRGQNLANTSFAGAVGRGADFRDANLHGAILTKVLLRRPTFAAPISLTRDGSGRFRGNRPARNSSDGDHRLRQQLQQCPHRGS